MPARVSVLMSCYNSEKTVGASIASVLQQTFSDWELIIVDDASTDRSIEIIAQFVDGRIQLHRQPNSGWPAARNNAARFASGRYLAFLDSDDTWHPTFLGRMVDALDANPQAVLAYCGWQNVGLTGGRGEPFVPPEYDGLDRADLLLGGCRWPIHGAMLLRKVFDEAGGFDTSFQASADYDLWLRVARVGTLVRVPEVLAFYHHHDGAQITKNKLKSALNHHRAQCKFLSAHPEEAERLGRKRVRELVDGELLRRAYACYWKRDLSTARALFRKVMRSGYGNLKDWAYMLPSLLPQRLHSGLVSFRDTQTSPTSPDRSK